MTDCQTQPQQSRDKELIPGYRALGARIIYQAFLDMQNEAFEGFEYMNAYRFLVHSRLCAMIAQELRVPVRRIHLRAHAQHLHRQNRWMKGES